MTLYINNWHIINRSEMLSVIKLIFLFIYQLILRNLIYYKNTFKWETINTTDITN